MIWVEDGANKKSGYGHGHHLFQFFALGITALTTLHRGQVHSMAVPCDDSDGGWPMGHNVLKLTGTIRSPHGMW